MGLSLCLASGKDGTGKSVITANLGVMLSQMGISTIIVDGDLEGASIGLVLGIDPTVPSIHDCLAGKIDCEETIIEAFDTKVIVGGITMEQVVDASIEGFPEVIERLAEKFDLVLVDAPAGLGNNAVTVISSCQSTLLVLTPDINSATNGLKTLAVAKKVGTSILGAVTNRSGSPYDIPADKLEELLRVKVIADIKNDEYVQRSMIEAVPAVLEYPNCEFSRQMKHLANTLVGND